MDERNSIHRIPTEVLTRCMHMEDRETLEALQRSSRVGRIVAEAQIA